MSLSSTVAIVDSSPQNGAVAHDKSVDGGFNDAATADVVLRLHFDQSADYSATSAIAVDQSEVQIYLHSRVLRRSKYFDALLLDRWQQQGQDDDESSLPSEKSEEKFHRLNLAVPASAGSFDHHLKDLEMLYSNCLPVVIDSVATAISILPVALELLFEDCFRACIRFLEAVPWSEDEENRILNLIPFLTCHEEAKELVARVSVSPAKADHSVEMLYGLIYVSIFKYPNMVAAKAFVTKLLRDFASKDVVRVALDMAFQTCLFGLKQHLEEYHGPDYGGDHYEAELLIAKGYNLLWLVETMVELRIADSAVKAWSEQAPLVANLESILFPDGAMRDLVSLPDVVLRCTSRLASSVATGNVVAARQVRLELVRDWLPVLDAFKNTLSPMEPDQKSLCLELEESFLSIISTLPICDAKELLQKCISFPDPDVDDCPTWLLP